MSGKSWWKLRKGLTTWCLRGAEQEWVPRKQNSAVTGDSENIRPLGIGRNLGMAFVFYGAEEKGLGQSYVGL